MAASSADRVASARPTEPLKSENSNTAGLLTLNCTGEGGKLYDDLPPPQQDLMGYECQMTIHRRKPESLKPGQAMWRGGGISEGPVGDAMEKGRTRHRIFGTRHAISRNRRGLMRLEGTYD